MSQVTAVTQLVVLTTVSVVPVLSDCNVNEPNDCDFFYNNPCGWELDVGWNVTRQESSRFLEFKDELTGRAESRLACSTNGTTHCLKFLYRFERDGTVDLNVIINSSSSLIGETVVWTLSSSASWENAEVPVKSDQDFTVIIEAKVRSGQDSSRCVLVDDISYKRSSCNTRPSHAEPTTTSTTTITTTTTTSAPETTTTTAEAIHSTSTTTTSIASAKQTTTTGSTTPALFSVTADQSLSAQSQTDLATIVGAVAGVVVVVIAVVVVLLIFRRKRLLFWKTSVKANKWRGEHSDVPASHNATYNLDLRDQRETADMNMTAIDTGHNDRSQHDMTSPHSYDDYYNAIPTADKETTSEPPTQLYAEVNKPHRPNPATMNTPHQESTPHPSHQIYTAVNKPRRPNPGSQPNVSESTDDSPDEIGDDASVSKASQPAGDAVPGWYTCQEDDPESQQQLDTADLYFAPDTDTDTTAQHLNDVPPRARTTSPTAPCLDQKSHQPSLTSHSHDDEYNNLDLGGRRRVMERVEGDGPNLVYSGLNEGDGDTYNEANHHRRREIIDDQYSHFQ